MAPRLDRSKWVAKTQAKAIYCLTDRELEGLACEERPNPRNRKGPPMKLLPKEELERAALAKWGSLAALEAERAQRQERREQRAITSYFQQVQQAQQEGQAQQQAPAELPPQVPMQPGGAPGAAGEGEQPMGAEQQVGAPAAGPAPQQQQQQQRPSAAPLPAPGGAAARQLPWLQALPPLIAERVCPVPRQVPAASQQAAVAAAEQPQYVLYWMKSALRGHENPALDAAAAVARHLGLPLLVASFLLASHPYASVRRYKFVLEGLADAQAELARQGVPLLVYLEGWSQQAQQGEQAQQQGEQAQQAQQPTGSGATQAAAEANPYQPGFSFHPRDFQQTDGWRALVRLASSAAVVVTEDLPVPPDAVWLEALARELPPAVQLAAVDTACLLPMRLVRKAHEKAYTFRAATEGERRRRIAATYTPPPSGQLVGPAAVAPAPLGGLPPLPPHLRCAEWLGWQPLDAAGMLAPQLHQALLRCPGLDRSVPGVAQLVGGSRAGYERWERFRKGGLSLYAARRNDAMQRDGVSRLSAYHHWGMVSPFKVAREAALDKSAGAAKFLDEFLIWREISHNLCLHRFHQLHSLAVLPRWAQATLEEHAGDPRPAALPYPQLDSGSSGDAWWDAAQHQLVKTGELHNNSRMTWGKAFLQWAPSPQAALSAALHCNHRWALDGCDPASYAGVLWCFGMFDSPKGAAATPIYGSLAQRSTAAHARRVPPAAYAQLPA